jgi:tetratricopeptide (TPR) repeat protein
VPWLTSGVFKQAPDEPLTKLPRFDDGPASIRFRHLVHAYTDKAVPENTAVQSITFDTIEQARRFAQPDYPVMPVAITYPEDAGLVPAGVVPAPPLERVVTDVARFAIPRALPLLFDIIGAGMAAPAPPDPGTSSVEFVILSNSDIHLQPPFYRVAGELIRRGYDAVTINRRTIDAAPGERSFTPLFMAEPGTEHPGFDCFIFAARLVPAFETNACCCGAPYVMRSLLFNIVAQARRFLMLTQAHLTFHLGDDRHFRDESYADYLDFNVAEARSIVERLARNPEKAERLRDFIDAHEPKEFRAALLAVLPVPGVTKDPPAAATGGGTRDEQPLAARDGPGIDLAERESAAKQAQARRNWVGAVALWEACLGAAPGHPRALAWRSSRAVALIACGRHDEAEAEYSAMAKDHPNAPNGFAGQAAVAQARKEWDLAIERWDACVRRFPGHRNVPSWCEAWASALFAAGRLADAEGAYRRVAQDRPEAPAGLVGQAKVAETRLDWQAAVARWEECLRRFPDDPAASAWRVARARGLVEDGRLAEAEEAYRAVAAGSPDDPTGLAGLAHVARARGDWAAATVRLDECLAAFPDHPSVTHWRATRARSLERLESWAAALAAWTAARAAGDPRAVIGQARCLLETFGPSPDAERVIDDALRAYPNDKLVLRLYARLARERADYREAMARWTVFARQHPQMIEPYLGCIDAAFRCGDAQGAASLIDTAPPELAATMAFRANVQLQFYRRFNQTDRGLAIVREIDPSTIDRPSANSVCQYLYDAGLFEDMEDFAGQVLPRFPSDRELIGNYLRATRLGSGAARFEAEKARLLSLLPESATPVILSWLQPAWLTVEEAKRVIDCTIASHISDAKKTNRLVAIAFHPDPQALSHLARRLGSEGDAAFRIFGRLLLAEVRDQRRIALANLGGGSWAEFGEEAASLRRDTADLLVAPDADRLARRFLETAARLQRACERSRAAWIATGESWYEAASLVAWLSGRIAAGEPTSLIRLGDGEGNFLPYAAEDAKFQAEDQRLIQEVWWGVEMLSPAHAVELGSRLQTAIRRADAVGLPPIKRLLMHLNHPLDNSTANCRGLCAAVAFVERQPAAAAKRQILSSLHLHADLDRWDLFRQILAPVSSVSVISCLDLSHLLAERFGVGVRRWFRIPPEYRYRALLAEPGYEPERPFYPDLFAEMMAEVAPLPGELFLVAAGFLGKILCDRIRERGGIGFDIGSVADSWMGYATRFYTGAALEFDPASSLIEGQPFADRFDMRAISRAEPCRSDRARRSNLTDRFGALFEAAATIAEPSSYALRIVGHPRCGSVYLTVVLSRLGMQIGHERPSAHGVCSWIHAVEDLNPPFDTTWLPASAFRGMMAYVRDPAAALPSIILEDTGAAASFAFRRFHIARALGVDIAMRRDPLERAVESYLSWMEIIERQKPLLTLRVERLIDDVAANADIFERLGLPVDFAAVADAATIPSNLNPSREKFNLDKPVIEAGRYAALPAALGDGLGRFCERYGYASAVDGVACRPRYRKAPCGASL